MNELHEIPAQHEMPDSQDIELATISQAVSGRFTTSHALPASPGSPPSSGHGS
jgi:hypothetical protein